MDTRTDTIIEWTANRRLHVVAPSGLLPAEAVQILRRFAKDQDDLDVIAEAAARLLGHPVRARPYQAPTADFVLEVETPLHR